MEFLPVRVNTLRVDAAVNFDVYIQVGEKKIHYIRNEDPISGETIQKLKTKKVKRLFIPLESESKYLQYLETGLVGLKDSSKSLEERASLANDAIVTVAENIEHNLETQLGYDQTNKQFGHIVDFLVSDQGAIKKILGAAGCALDNQQHAASVASLSLALATRLEISDNNELVQLGIAGLVHDLAKAKFPFSPLKPRGQLTGDERKIYERHPADAAAMLSGKPFITPRILGLVADHEEVGRGKGFPEKKDLAKLHKVYQIFNLCNDFDRFCYESSIIPLNAIDPFFEKRGELFSADHMTLLATVLT